MKSINIVAGSIFYLLIISFSTGYIYSQNVGTSARIEINKISLPFNNKGELADVTPPDTGYTNGYFEGHEFLFSGGFFMSGYTNNSLWANGVQGVALLKDYQPGTVGMEPNDPDASIYRVGTPDPPFGQSWQDWSDAVDLGADYYDGDGNGIYDPVDLNNNGMWDPSEDKPGIIGDESFWCVYNDGVPPIERIWGSEPQGIEIRQTIFGFTSTDILDSVVFVRYRIKNTGLLTDTIKDVYFCHYADPDIGEVIGYEYNYVGCDTIRNAIYTYLKEPSPPDWGNNPPCFLTDLLTGPLSYIPGVSFEDLNSNGIYDEGIDIPFDTAYSFRGPLGVPVYPGALNLNMSSAIYGIHGDPVTLEPGNIFEARNNLLGKTIAGDIVDPCSWPYAGVFGGVPCDEIDPYFWSSGDPVSNTGWISILHADVRDIQSTGPFKLVKNKEIEILFAFIIGRGDSALGSVTVTKNISDEIQSFYENNFGYPYVLAVKDNNINKIDFALNQNYPNPVNPATTSKYSIPKTGLVKLAVYDILGKEIKVLINEEQSAGAHEVSFDAGKLSSGIYFYRIQNGNYFAVKKMMLLK